MASRAQIQRQLGIIQVQLDLTQFYKRSYILSEDEGMKEGKEEDGGPGRG